MSKYKLFIVTTLYLLSLNIIFNVLIFNNLIIQNILFYIFESITISTILNIIIELFKNKTKKVLLIISTSLISIFYIAQFIHYRFYDCFFSIYSLVHGSQVFGFIPAIIKVISNNIIGFLILLALIPLFIIIIIKTKDKDTNHKKIVLTSILIINILLTITTIYFSNNNNIYSKKALLKSTNVETKNTNNFGLVTAMTIDLYRFTNNPHYNLILNDNNETYDKDKYNITNIDFNIKTKDKELKELTKYLKNQKPTNKNEYTGILKDKNLIFITAESFSFNLIDKDLTPTLYKMTQEGISFNNFYTPIYYASTSDGEYTNLTGLLPREGRWSYIDIKNNVFPYTYSNVLKTQNYELNSYHNGIYNFYKRNEIMPSLGYNFKACGNGLENYINCKLWPQSDDEMITETFKDYKNTNRFHTYYMSISGHLNHNFTNNDMAKKHQEKVNNLNYSTATKAYISANIDIDKALEKLLNNLEIENKINDTVIVLVPDHFPYGLSKKEYKELKQIDKEYNKHKSGLIIYNPTLTNTQIDKYASNIDILPTLLNMYGIDYDSRLLVGKDIMSNSEGIVMFNDHSFLTDKGFYNENTNKFTGSISEENYIKEKQIQVFNSFNASSLILEKNYYKYIK